MRSRRGRAPGRLRISFEQASALEDSLPATTERLARARVVYRVDCRACHGADGRGRTPVGRLLAEAGAEPPTDFASPRVRGRSDGELHWLITNGIGGMPPLGELLSDEERWLAVRAVRELAGG